MLSIFKISSILAGTMIFATGTQFLAIPATGIEQASGTNATEYYSINPARISVKIPGSVLQLSHGNWMADANVSTVRLFFPGRQNPFTLNLKYVDMDGLELRSDRPTDEPLAHFGASGLAIGGSSSTEWKGLNIGATLHFVRIDLYTENSSGFALDLGMTKELPTHITLGGAILNLGKMSALKQEKPELPLRLISTASFRYETGPIKNDISITGEWSKLNNDGIMYVTTASHYEYMQLRLGSKIARNVTEISGGISLRFGMYGLSYGIRFGSQDIGFPQMLDLTIHIP